MTTYNGTAAQITRNDRPVDVATTGETPEAFIEELWASLQSDIRVAAFAITPDEPARAPVVFASR